MIELLWKAAIILAVVMLGCAVFSFAILFVDWLVDIASGLFG